MSQGLSAFSIAQRSVLMATSAVALVCGSGVHLVPNCTRQAVRKPPVPVQFFEPGWSLQVARELPERVCSLAVAPDWAGSSESIYVGTGPVGGIYRFCPDSPPDIITTVAIGLGDAVDFGTCNVTRLAVRDLDHDGVDELLTETSQVQPPGPPRLYVWSLTQYPLLRGFARPDIESSWSHGLAVTRGSDSGSDRIVSTYCGYGEIIEYELVRQSAEGGFHHQALAWRQVGRLPASGEGAQTADVDNDGRPDLCLATGFANGRAAVHVYERGEQGLVDQPKHILNEAGRFFNVKFIVVDLGDVRGHELIAWWCTSVTGGDCEIIRYQLGPGGLCDREVIGRGDAASLWPMDGQMTVVDSDDSRKPAVWFATVSGNLWRYDLQHQIRLAHVCRIEGEVGPILGVSAESPIGPRLYLGCDRRVLELRSAEQ
jgi:hypothetical protein